MRKFPLFLIIIVLAISFLMAGCQSVLPGFFPAGTQVAKTQQAPLPTNTPLVSLPAEPNSTQAAQLNRLIVWVPAEFNPQSTLAGQLLQEHIDLFVQENPEIAVELRVKNLYGPAGLLTSLEQSLAVAPMAAPALVLLPQSDFQNAANLGLIQADEQLEELIGAEDWYDYATMLAQAQNRVFGVPFAADALILLYRPAVLTVPPSNWGDILAYGSPILFPVEDDKALFPLNLYLSSGGPIYDEQRQISLDPAILEQVLSFFSEGVETGTFPAWIAQYNTDEQVWASLQQKTTDLSITWISNYLSTFPADIAATTIPSLQTDSVTLVTGWLWAVSDPFLDSRDVTMRLLQHLTNGEFMAAWTLQSGYLPVRPSSMAVWENQVTNALLRQATVSAQNLPSHETLNIVGPALNEAVYNVLINGYLPSEAARTAMKYIDTHQ